MRQLELFFWGIIAALGALFAQETLALLAAIYRDPGNILSPVPLAASVPAVAVFVLVEEAFKYLIIARKVEPMSLALSFIPNSFIAGAGFAATEIALIAVQNEGSLSDLPGLAKIAAVHIGTSGLMGYLVAVGNPRRIPTILACLTAAFLPHFAFNLIALGSEELGYASQLATALIAMLTFFNIRNMFKLPGKLAS